MNFVNGQVNWPMGVWPTMPRYNQYGFTQSPFTFRLSLAPQPLCNDLLHQSLCTVDDLLIQRSTLMHMLILIGQHVSAHVACSHISVFDLRVVLLHQDEIANHGRLILDRGIHGNSGWREDVILRLQYSIWSESSLTWCMYCDGKCW